MKLLFICNQNQNRSKTAEALFRKNFETKSAGLFNSKPVTKEQIKWSDKVVVMEETQRNELAKRFPNEYMKKHILNLNIPDIYKQDQKELIELLNNKRKELF